MIFDFNTIVLIALLGIGVTLLIIYWMREDSEVESPRSQMMILEAALRKRGFRPLLHIVRDFEQYKEENFLNELQRLVGDFVSDDDFLRDWLEPILLANLGLVMKNPDVLMKLDLHLRREYGYRIKPVRHTTYGIRPQTVLHATGEEGDVCFKEENETKLARGKKVYTPLTEEAEDVTIDTD